MFDPDVYQPHQELTTDQAATIANKNRRTIVAWIHSGALPATQLPGRRGHYRITWQHLRDVLSKPAIPKTQKDPTT